MLLALNDNTKAVLSNYIISNLKYSSIYFKVFFNLSSPLKGYRNSVFWSLYERIKLWAANVRKKRYNVFSPPIVKFYHCLTDVVSKLNNKRDSNMRVLLCLYAYPYHMPDVA